MNAKTFRSIVSLHDTFRTEDDCKAYFEKLRWPNGMTCPSCSSTEKFYLLKNGQNKCAKCKSNFTLKTGTIFQNSNLTFKQWFDAIFFFVTNKKGITSIQLAKIIGTTQPNAWYVLQRLRYATYNRKSSKMKGIVEVDETFVGGKNKNRHYDKKVKHSQGRSTKDKAPVLGFRERDGKLFLLKLESLRKRSLQALIRYKVIAGSTVATDEYRAYIGLNKFFDHGTCNHGQGQYVNGKFHTNNIEGFWGFMKRGMTGVYQAIKRKYLMLYCKEFEFKFNNRKLSVGESFDQLLLQFCGKKLGLATLRGRR